jgi:hypothetical protein
MRLRHSPPMMRTVFMSEPERKNRKYAHRRHDHNRCKAQRRIYVHLPTT